MEAEPDQTGFRVVAHGIAEIEEHLERCIRIIEVVNLDRSALGHHEQASHVSLRGRREERLVETGRLSEGRYCIRLSCSRAVDLVRLGCPEEMIAAVDVENNCHDERPTPKSIVFPHLLLRGLSGTTA
jgi:hypothetical protein